jgi:predicted metalloendopeptidase
VPTRNEIIFPSAILQPPFFVPPTPEMPHGDSAVNFA